MTSTSGAAVRCGDCKFWSRSTVSHEKEYGDCRRYAPRPLLVDEPTFDALAEIARTIQLQLPEDERTPIKDISGSGAMPQWPETREDCWCGEFKEGSRPYNALGEALDAAAAGCT